MHVATGAVVSRESIALPRGARHVVSATAVVMEAEIERMAARSEAPKREHPWCGRTRL